MRGEVAPVGGIEQDEIRVVARSKAPLSVGAPEDEAISRNGKRSPQRAKAPASGQREVQPPSWRKVGKRGLLFAPLMFLTVTFLSGDLTMTQRLVNTAFLLAFFLPFSYAMDALMYRLYKKRAGAR